MTTFDTPADREAILNATIENGLRSDLVAHVDGIAEMGSALHGTPVEAMHRACAAYHGLLASVAAAESAGAGTVQHQ